MCNTSSSKSSKKKMQKPPKHIENIIKQCLTENTKPQDTVI